MLWVIIVWVISIGGIRMGRELTNGHMFFAYHIRSAFLMNERALQDMLNERDVSTEHFYILQCDWSSQQTAFDAVKAHAILSTEDTTQSLNDLIVKGYVVKGNQEGFYALSQQGHTLRAQLLEDYHAQISKAMEGLSEKTIETALSSLLTILNNFQQT